MKKKCPTCKKVIESNDPERDSSFLPFCSKRCQLVDLGKWLDGNYSLEMSPDEEQEQDPDFD